LRFGRPTDRDALVAAFEQLSPRSRYLRFFQRLSYLPTALIDRLTDVDEIDRVAVVAFIADHPETLIGVVRYIRYSESRNRADIALTVLDQYQGQGLASQMYDVLADIAIERGIDTFTADVLRENIPMLKFFRARNGETKVDPDDGAAMKVTLAVTPTADAQRIDA